MADTGLATHHPLHRDENIVARIRAILEHAIERKMKPADIHTRYFSWDQRERYTDIFIVENQMFGVIKFEYEAEQGRQGA